MVRAISSISFSGQLEDKIEAAAAAGFDAIEIFREDIIGFDGPPEDIPAFAQRAGIGILSLQSLRDFEALSGEARAAAFRRAERVLDLAVRVDAPIPAPTRWTIPPVPRRIWPNWPGLPVHGV